MGNIHHPLSTLSSGQKGTIIRLGVEKRVRRRLLDMGLTPGATFAIIRAEGGPLLLAVRNSRLALGRDLAQHIIVQLV